MATLSFEALIRDCDSLLKAGRPQLVARELALVNASRVPRQFRLPLAHICRRAGMNAFGLKLLQPLMQKTGKTNSPATSSEIAEYAALLLRSGALREAENLLAAIDVRSAPEALLFRAFLHFVRFEFTDAIPLLENYLNSPLEPYAQVVGSVNLAFARVSAGLPGALELLDEVILTARKNRHVRLESNCLALRAQALIRQGALNAAAEHLEHSRQLLGGARTHDSQFIAKWLAFLAGYQSGSNAPILEYRRVAEASDDWDGMRECDFHSLQIKFEKVRFNHLVFGTPFSAYREFVCRELGHEVDQSTYLLGSKRSPRFDLQTCDFKGAPLNSVGSLSHQLLDVLLRDFYRPLSVGGVFSELFPNELFDVFTSPTRIHQLMRRTRLWLSENDVPVSIDEANGKYQLRLRGDICFKVPLERQPVDFMSLHFDSLKKSFARKPRFSAREIRDRLMLSRTSVQRLINWGLGSGKLEKLGEKNSTQYRLIEASSNNPLKTAA